MSRSLGHNDLVRLFGGKPVQVPPDAIENNGIIQFFFISYDFSEEENYYKASNKSLVTKNAALKVSFLLLITVVQSEIFKLKNMINDLRGEILEKDCKIALLESEMNEEKIDLLVAERFQVSSYS